MTVFSLSQNSTAVDPANMMQDPLPYRDLGQNATKCRPWYCFTDPESSWAIACLTLQMTTVKQLPADGAFLQQARAMKIPFSRNSPPWATYKCWRSVRLFLFFFEHIIISLQYSSWPNFYPLFISSSFPNRFKTRTLDLWEQPSALPLFLSLLFFYISHS